MDLPEKIISSGLRTIRGVFFVGSMVIISDFSG